ncbi:hypothetical protein F5887DRAFT_1156895 [Amanita rubescens]|nr:hypothetical protein F5887DRAFT_1156895 [Amanita rubescens]
MASIGRSETLPCSSLNSLLILALGSGTVILEFQINTDVRNLKAIKPMAPRPERLRHSSNTTPSYHGEPSDTKMNPPVPKVQVQNDLLKYKAELKAHTQRLEAHNQRFEERVEEHIDAYEKESKTAKALNRKLERDVRELKERVNKLEPTVAHIHRRIVLNDARNKLKSSYGYKFDFGDSVEKRVQDFLPKLAFSDGSIHAQGNRAAHEATLESKLLAVSLGDDLPLERRDNMLKLLRFAYDV